MVPACGSQKHEIHRVLDYLILTNGPGNLAKDRCYVGPRDGNRYSVDQASQNTVRALYPMRVVLEGPYILQMINSLEVLNLASSYLGCRPTISQIGLYWSFPNTGLPRDGTQIFHRDRDDWRFLKFFVYLSDVDENSGPHEYVLRSRRESGQFCGNEFAKDDTCARYGADRIRRVIGPRGTSFVGDTWGIHRGDVPARTARLIFQVQYSIFPIRKYCYRHLPIRHNLNIDPYVNGCFITPR